MSLTEPTATDLESVQVVLDLCERGRMALSEAKDIAEARHVWAYATTMATATKAKDLAVEAANAAYRLRIDAERRIAQLIAEQPKNRGGRPRLAPVETSRQPQEVSPPTVPSYGVSHDELHEYRKLADASDDEYEAAVDRVEQRVNDKGHMITRAAVLRELDPEGEKNDAERALDLFKFASACERLTKLTEAAIVSVRFGYMKGEPDIVRNGANAALVRARDAITAVLKEMDR